ncbi:MAG: dTDP-4-dehydrorhamnose 3,5-epimerase family protein [Rikenellaceae bacterium]
MAKSKAKFTVKETQLEGVLVIRPEVCGGDRSYLWDLDTQDEYKKMGLELDFVEHTSERFSRGVLRGLYFRSNEPYGKLISVKSGMILCVAVDMRPEHRDFGAAQSVVLTADEETMFYIPQYFAYGFLVLEGSTEVIVNMTDYYDESQESGIIWDDNILAIDWQFDRFDIDKKYLHLTQRDKRFSAFRSYNIHELWPNRPKKSKYAISY